MSIGKILKHFALSTYLAIRTKLDHSHATSEAFINSVAC